MSEPTAYFTPDFDTLNKLGVPRFETVATTGSGVEETLKGNHAARPRASDQVKKYNLEGSEPLDIQILNPLAKDSLWENADERHVPPPAATPKGLSADTP
jgi:hypothetical protein